MLIRSLNSDMGMPPYKEYEKAERKRLKQLEEEERKRKEKLKVKAEEIIGYKFLNKELYIAIYKDAIINYLINNAKFELINDSSKIELFINLCFKILSNKDVTIIEYVLLQSLSRTKQNIIVEEIRRQYENAKKIVIDEATKESIIRKTDYNNDKINEIIDELIKKNKKEKLNMINYNYLYEKYKNKSEEVKSYICRLLGISSFEDILFKNSISDACTIINYIETNTDIESDHYIKSNVLERRLR